MPDEQVSIPDMQEYGYFYDGMLPVTRERALELDVLRFPGRSRPVERRDYILGPRFVADNDLSPF